MIERSLQVFTKNTTFQKVSHTYQSILSFRQIIRKVGKVFSNMTTLKSDKEQSFDCWMLQTSENFTNLMNNKKIILLNTHLHDTIRSKLNPMFY